MVLLGIKRKNIGVTMVLLMAQRKNDGFTLVLLRVKQKATRLQRFCSGSNEKHCLTVVLLWFCIGFGNENAMVLKWFWLGSNEKALLLQWFCVGSNQKHWFYNGFA